jgi:hypothetical protein
LSRPPFAPDEAIDQLRRDGYAIEVREGALLVHDVPYVDATRTVRRVVLAEPLEYAGDQLQAPRDHTLLFCGDHPCDADVVGLGLLSGKTEWKSAPSLGSLMSRKLSSALDRITSL